VRTRQPVRLPSGNGYFFGGAKAGVLRIFLMAFLPLVVALFFVGCAGFGDYGTGAGAFDTVVLDAGHGAHDLGALSVRGEPEKMLALDVVLRMKPLLEDAGYRVVMTRDRDVFIPLETRAAISNRNRGAIFVSIHFNWAKKRSPEGIEIYYFSERSRRLAANILEESLRAYRCADRGVKFARFHVLRNNLRPSVLCELGFVSNPYDNQMLQNPRVRQRLAEAVVRGIIDERRGKSPRL